MKLTKGASAATQNIWLTEFAMFAKTSKKDPRALTAKEKLKNT